MLVINPGKQTNLSAKPGTSTTWIWLPLTLGPRDQGHTWAGEPWEDQCPAEFPTIGHYVVVLQNDLVLSRCLESCCGSPWSLQLWRIQRKELNRRLSLPVCLQSETETQNCRYTCVCTTHVYLGLRREKANVNSWWGGFMRRVNRC